jgi:putative transcriptional regulator
MHKLSKGDLLMSEPFLPDPNFERSVIMLTEYNQVGSLGFVINRQSDMVLDDFGEIFQNMDTPVYIGGPVEQNTLHFIHSAGDKISGATQVSPTFYWGGNIEETVRLVKIGVLKDHQIRFFVGYSGWSKGQLDAELNAKTWIHLKKYQENLFEIDPSNMWREILKNQEGELKIMANYPLDPRMN